MDPDAQRMLQFQRGDPSAFEALFEKYRRPILNFCYRFLGDAHEAEDIAQETFLQVYQAAPGYRPLTKFSTWLYTITKNRCLNRLRSLRREEPAALFHTGEEEDREPAEPAASLPDPEQALGQKEMTRIVREAVANLPAGLRLALVLRRYHDLPYAEIAQVTGCSLNAVKLRVHRANRILARRLAPYLAREPKRNLE